MLAAWLAAALGLPGSGRSVLRGAWLPGLGLGVEWRRLRRGLALRAGRFGESSGWGAGPQPLRCSALVLLLLVKGLGVYGVMLGAVGVRGKIVDQAFFQQGFCSSAALVETAAFYEVCRKLQTAAHVLHFVGDVQVVLHGLIAFGVRDDYRDALALNGIHGALPVDRQACGGKFQQQQIGVFNAQVLRGFYA